MAGNKGLNVLMIGGMTACAALCVAVMIFGAGLGSAITGMVGGSLFWVLAGLTVATAAGVFVWYHRSAARPVSPGPAPAPADVDARTAPASARTQSDAPRHDHSFGP
ncbi:MAG TPA: hypothetical protein VGR21_06160 [Cryptosporangiaceae bacterium]|nr:hypothetical protein [Cryptosporangiaceae bacterium]